MASLEEYIRYSAAQRGIDPDIAVRVAKAEGGLQDPVQQSRVMKNGVREPSYGPFQLLIGGEGTGFPAGLGNAALAQGIDPRNPEHALKAIDFALDTAAKKGWGQWYGAKAVGLDNFAGIGGRPATAVASAAPPAPVFGAPAPSPNPQVASFPSSVAPTVPASMQQDIPAAAQAVAGRAAPKSAADVFGMMAMMGDQDPQFSPVQIQGPSPAQSQGLLQLVQALKQRLA
jgi:hypothetical protein